MSLFLSFSSDVEAKFKDIVDNHAPLVWEETGADFSTVRVCAGMVAPYGHHRAHYNKGLIAFSAQNEKSCFKESNGKLVPRQSLDVAIGVFWHELAHHAVYAASAKPWKGLRAGKSTHSRPAWCWAVAKAWQYLHPEWSGTPNMVADEYRRNEGFAKVLQSFVGNEPPPVLESVVCMNCGDPLINKRAGARFCNSNCRVASFRKKRSAQPKG